MRGAVRILHLRCRRRSGPALLIASLIVIMLAAPAPVPASPTARSPVVGLYPLPLEPGANFISAPLHGLTVWRGTVAQCASNRLTVTGSPAWATDRFAQHTVAGTVFAKYLVIITRAPGAQPDPCGDWWPVRSNTPDTLVVNPGPDAPAAVVRPGDEIELRRLVTLRDLFGDGDSLVLNPDHNGFPTPFEEDVIRFVEQTFFTREIFYHDGALTGGTPGYVVDGQGPFDGADITVTPGQPLLVFRRDGSTNATVLVAGQVQQGAFTQRLQPGANPIAVPFPTACPLAASGLLAAGWKSDHDGDSQDDDQIRKVTRTSFTEEVYHHDGTQTDGRPTWVCNGNVVSDYPLAPGSGYIFLVRGSQPLRWRHAAPTAP